MIYEPRFLKKAVGIISEKPDLYYLPVKSEILPESELRERFGSFFYPDKEKFREAVAGLTRAQVTDILLHLPELLGFVEESKVISFISLRYRRYMFRMIYMLWQDNFEFPPFRNVMLFILGHPKTPEYIKEIGFTAEELRSVVLSDNNHKRLVELSLDHGISVREFLLERKISLTSYLAVDVLGVFFLFCSGDDCLVFGTKKIIWALERFDLRNRAKVINNIYSKLTPEQRRNMPELLQFIISQHGIPDPQDKDGFWSMIHVKVIRDMIDDDRAPRSN